MTIEISIEDSRWDDAALHEQARTAICTTLEHLGFSPDEWEISLLGCDDTRIAALNAEFREKTSPTNVLSWPAQELSALEPGGQPSPPEVDFMGDAELGDIAISFDTCLREADEAKKPLDDHIRHLIVHGVLHLLGYDHIRDADATLMEELEVVILGKLGVSDPYILETGP